MAVENRVRADGGHLRSFRFTKNTAANDRCQHAVADAVLIGGRETAEHRWLKRYVLEAARELGYEAELERPLKSGLVADVWIDDAVSRRRVEVQRVRTDIPARTERDADVLWLLRETSRNNKDMNTYLFTNPCVRVSIFGAGRRPVHPWDDPDAAFEIRVFATVLRRTENPNSPRDFFETGEMPLRTFLREVWSGERRWVNDRTVYKFASWARDSDLEVRRAWVQARRERAAAAREAALEARRQAQRQLHEQRARSVAEIPRPPQPERPAEPSVSVPPAPHGAPPRVPVLHRPVEPPPVAPVSAWRRLIDWLRGR
ncbi:hypothetical protein FK529_03080 [Tsukamurella asaccharolytica]|uniref:Uncharacterized protein n=1 Tax=Tsukamurella asaccharolytica TaxID=2592067 RepID=A0A5C5RGQ6_9ACTN|nr:hypothetical protein [Tsukamurella asaccharolytica]TWS21583.1 hypothetical protein FK529_03080 [Tsukamurella asaccharolytica]